MMRITEKSIGLDGKVFPERRGALRRRVQKHARVHFRQGRCTLLGMMLDQSTHGARIRFGDICAMPETFELEIEGSERLRRATIRWRSLTEIGIALD